MRAWDLLATLDAKLLPADTKIHLAVHNGYKNPLDVYAAGEFPEWQASQARRNFERDFVLALIQMSDPEFWMFAGAYSSHGCRLKNERYTYRLKERPACREFDGRLVVRFQRPGRQSYLNAEPWIDHILVSHITAEPISIMPFCGFKHVRIPTSQLDLIVRKNPDSWSAPLSSVAGVYLIADPKSGRFYVGSATGQGGIWQRWAQYAANGHGGNRELKALVRGMTTEQLSRLEFSILEIADTHASDAEVRGRESHWKSVLLTRIHGLNPK